MEEKFNEETCIETLRLLSGDQGMMEIPHYDTLNYYLEKLSPRCLSDLRKMMVKSLLKGKQFYRSRLFGKYWRVIFDGTGLSYFKEKHCENCRKNGWEYILTQKETRQKMVGESFRWIQEGDGLTEVKNIGKELGTGRYTNHVEEVAGKSETMNIYEYEYTAQKEDEEKSICFQWVTSIELNKRNLEEMIEAGRGRWRIENEGFNNQKNGIYQTKHLNSHDSNAMKNYYLLTQIADIIMQLYLAWNPLIREIHQSIKNTSSRLLESFRKTPVTDEDVEYIKRHTSVYLE